MSPAAAVHPMSATPLLGALLLLVSWIGPGLLLLRSDTDPMMPLLLAATAAVLTVPVWLAARTHRFDPAEPVWLLTVMYAISFWLRPLLVVYDPDIFAVSFVSYEQSAMIGASGVALVALVGFYLGYYSPLPRSLAPALPRLPWPWSRSRTAAALFGCAALFAYLGIHFFSKGQFSFEYIYANRTLINWGDGDLAQLIQLTGWLVVILAVALYSTSPRPSVVSAVAFVTTTVAVEAVLSIFGARWSLFFIIGSLIIVWHYTRRRLRVRQWVAIFVCFFVASSLFGVWRQSFDLSDIRPELILLNVVIETYQYLEWDVLSEIFSVYPVSENHSYGKLSLETVFWLIPRRLWPDKPVWYGTTTIQRVVFPGMINFSDEGGFVGTFLTISTAGEGYVEFGWLGAILYMFTFGVAWRLIYDFKELSRNSFPSVAAYAVLVIGIPIYIRGFTHVVLVVFAWFFLQVVLFRWLGNTPQRAGETVVRSSP
jgi:hypothetical protein